MQKYTEEGTRARYARAVRARRAARARYRALTKGYGAAPGERGRALRRIDRMHSRVLTLGIQLSAFEVNSAGRAGS